MRLKPAATLFTGTILILSLLIGVKTGYHTKLYNAAVTWVAAKLDLPLPSPKKLPKTGSKIENIILAQLEKLQTPRSIVTIDHLLEDSSIVIDAPVPRGKPIEWIVMQLCAPVDRAGYHVEDCMYEDNPVRCRIQLSSSKKNHPTVRITLHQSRQFFSGAAKMAVVIADFGFEATTTSVEFLSFPEPLTVSLVGSKKMSTWTAQIANEYRKEIVLLLPMEPLSSRYANYADKVIKIHYPEDKIRSMLRGANESIPNFAGYSNLGGTRVMPDSPVMRIIMTELKRHHGYFLIDRVSQKSVAAKIARDISVPYRGIDIALDSSVSAGSSVADTIRHAAMIAQKTGTVVLQGRATAQLIAALNDQLAFLKENGIKLVYLSEVVHHPDEEGNKVDRK